MLNTLPMANQRKKTKVHVGGYYEKELKEGFVKAAKANGFSTVSQALEKLIRNFSLGHTN